MLNDLDGLSSIKKIITSSRAKIIVVDKTPNNNVRDSSRMVNINFPDLEGELENYSGYPGSSPSDTPSLVSLDSWKLSFLSLVLDKVQLYYNNGLAAIPLSTKDMDTIYEEIIDSQCHVDMIDDNIRCKSTVLYENFKDWFRECNSNSNCPSKSSFKVKMNDLGFINRKKNDWYYLYIAIKEPTTLPTF